MLARVNLPGGSAEIRSLLSTLDVGTSIQLARAFSTYFQLANVAEQLHRSREQRAQVGGRLGPLRAVMEQLARDVDRAEVQAVLARMELRPVFTTHPTEACRRLPDVYDRYLRFNVDEPYRLKCSFINARLIRTHQRIHDGAPHQEGWDYLGAESYLADLQVMDISLRGHLGERIAEGTLARTLRSAGALGLHLAALDVREHADSHHAALVAARPCWPDTTCWSTGSLPGCATQGEAGRPQPNRCKNVKRG